MIVYFHGLEYPYVVVMDVEHDQGHLIQYAGILLQNIGNGMYQIARSVNFYVKKAELNEFTVRYTHINTKFLATHGMELEEAQQLFYDEFLEDINPKDVVFVSHGVHQDSIVMKNSGFFIDNSPHLCTYNLSKMVLKRERRIKLGDVLMESGLCSVLEHNAYTDALETINVLSFLLKVGGDEIYEKIPRH